jgi:hypothetical protein
MITSLWAFLLDENMPKHADRTYLLDASALVRIA